jgi:hypothetical protein
VDRGGSCYGLGIVHVTDDVCSVIATSRLPVGLLYEFRAGWCKAI